MRRIMAICLGGVILLGASATAFPANRQGEKEKVFSGKTISEWCELLKKSTKVKQRQAIIIFLAGVDEKYNHPDANILTALVDCLKEDSDAEVRATAAEALGGIGPMQTGKKAEYIAGVLTEALNKKGEAASVRQAAAKGLGGKMWTHAVDGVSALAAALSDSNAEVRTAAAVSLKSYGKIALQEMPKLLAAVKDTKLDQYTRTYTLQILVTHSDDASKLVPILVGLLKEEGVADGLKHAAINGLGAYFRDAQDATEPLLNILKSDKEPLLVRQSAAATLGKIQPEGSKVWPTLQKLMKDGDAPLRAHAIRLAAKLCRSEKDLVPALMDRCDDDFADAQIAAVQELGDLGSAAKPAIDTLKRLAETSARPTVRAAAAAALKKLQA